MAYLAGLEPRSSLHRAGSAAMLCIVLRLRPGLAVAAVVFWHALHGDGSSRL